MICKMRCGSPFSRTSSSGTTALLLTTFIIATFFARATVANHAPSPEKLSTLNVRESLGETIANGTRVNGARINSTRVNSTHANSITVSSQLKLAFHHQRRPAPNKCLFYTGGLYGPALYYANTKNLTTIWDVYSGFDYGPDVTKSFTNAEHIKFYEKLAFHYAQSCSGLGIVFWPGHSLPCNNSLFETEEQVGFLQNQGKSLSYVAVDIAWNATIQLCNDTRRFTGMDPTHYWGN